MDLSNGPDWQIVAISSITLLITVIGVYAKALAGRVDKIEESVINLHNLLYKEYHNKQDISALLADLKSGIEALHRRFDHAGFPNNGHGKEQ